MNSEKTSSKTTVSNDLNSVYDNIQIITTFIKRYLWLYALTLAFVITLAFLYCSFATKSYTSYVILKPGYEAEVVGKNTAMVFNASKLKAAHSTYFFQEHCLRLVSKDFLSYFIVKNDLLPILFPKKWDKEHGKWKNLSKVPTVMDGVDQLKSSIKFDLKDPSTGFPFMNAFIAIKLTLPGLLPSADVLNQMINDYNAFFHKDLLFETESKVAQYRAIIQESEYIEVRQTLINELAEESIYLADLRFEDNAAFAYVLSAIPDPKSESPRCFRVLFLWGVSGCIIATLIGICINARRFKATY